MRSATLLGRMLLKMKRNSVCKRAEKMKRNKITQQNVSHCAIIARSPMFSISFHLVHSFFRPFHTKFLSINFRFTSLSPHSMLGFLFVYTLRMTLRVTCTEHSTGDNNGLTVNFFFSFFFFLFFVCLLSLSFRHQFWTVHSVATINFVCWERIVQIVSSTCAIFSILPALA